MATVSDEAGSTAAEADAAPTAAEPARPALQIISGDATPEEIAAIVAVVSSLSGTPASAERPRSEWGSPHRRVRRTLPHGPGGWRSSSLPG